MIGILIFTVVSLVFSIILVNLESRLTKKDFKKEDYLNLLPGYNCGACGFGSCSGMADKMLEEVENYKKCKPLKGDALVKMEEYIKSNI